MPRTNALKIVTLSLLLALPAAVGDAQAQEAAVRVGTYDLQEVFQTLDLGRELEDRMASLQLEAQAAQQEGNQQRLQEIQREAQQAQQEVIEGFRSTLERLTPQIAEEQAVQVVAGDILYTSPGSEVVDLTDDVIRAMQAERE